MAGEHRSGIELGNFLRARRMQLRPEDVGLPSGGRRRTPGLRREELAVLAGVSVTWYTYLEQGRGKDASPAVLDSVASVLRLTEDERRHLHVLAHGKAPAAAPLTGDLPGSELVRRLVASLNRHPYPVYALNLYCDVIAWNVAAAEWYDDWSAMPVEERNMMLWLTTSPVAQQRLVGWDGEVRDIVARWRAMTSAWPDDHRLRQLIAKLRSVSADFAKSWDEHVVLEHRSRIRVFRHPRLGEFPLRAIVVDSPEFTPSFVVFHMPES
jgi:transcriptional regulator with XRE-family HTH domain